ncbi:hypothetical protein FIV42_08010 [Persicimonas caeni]|uniref:DUF1565 domain-containing protein n=1 Tax=Persicimonas caeni TaxID=2292766 RepID=A0A4Y6PQR7_PERCE|nr:hypothetical protein [Persicimonas caeni]QDG50674.1 hypothetical protein FIV42_08010 [Persicimonas caeni]QED31895.1 hypothetical protein FRD00_08005 [Persicimonas caeni]
MHIEDGPDLPDRFGKDQNCDGIDGDASISVFVSEDGDDGNDGLTMQTPVRSIDKGLEIASTTDGRDHVLVTAGAYNEVVTLENGVSIFGGYQKGTWARTPNARGETRIAPGSDDYTDPNEMNYRAVIADGISEVTVLDGVTVEGYDADGNGNPGASTYAVWVKDSERLALRFATIRAGNAADGVHGASGVEGADRTCSASGGTGGQQNTDSLSCPNPGLAESGTDGSAGSSPANGGGGGQGGTHYCVNDLTGCNAGDGATGVDGQRGADGTLGTFGSSWGEINGAYWQQTQRNEPTDGENGTGGGGGGAGGDCAYLGGTARGGAGGNGGNGGCGGQAGQNGQAGGASFGVFVTDSTITLRDVTVDLGAGGAGGRGGDGGAGAPEDNSTRTTGENSLDAGMGGNGGRGGAGGDGGAGAGGCGGPAIGVAFLNSTVNGLTNDTTIDESTGQAGQGGQGGQTANGTQAPGDCDGSVDDTKDYATL